MSILWCDEDIVTEIISYLCCYEQNNEDEACYGMYKSDVLPLLIAVPGLYFHLKKHNRFQRIVGEFQCDIAERRFELCRDDPMWQ